MKNAIARLTASTSNLIKCQRRIIITAHFWMLAKGQMLPMDIGDVLIVVPLMSRSPSLPPYGCVRSGNDQPWPMPAALVFLRAEHALHS
jgi:hypothetical protein